MSSIQALLVQGDTRSAIGILRRADPQGLQDPVLQCLYGDALVQQRRFTNACRCYRHAIFLEPGMAAAHNGLGNALLELGDFTNSLRSYDRAVGLAPDTPEFAFNRAQLRMLHGHWGDVRADYERRLASPTFQVHADIAAKPAWLGEAAPGKTILVYWEQGQGDTLQFVRYVAVLRERAMSVAIEAQDALTRLLAASFPEATVVSSRDPLPGFDLRAAIPSLPWLLETTPLAVHAPARYLRVPDGVAASPLSPGPGPAIGLLWAGNPRHVNDLNRSCPLDEILALASMREISWHSLQVDLDKAAVARLAKAGVADLGSGFNDFADTAAAIAGLDLVITVDTAVAHLAGALGKPTWLLLPFVPDWRWLLDRTDTPWYPSMRLFRQPARKDWTSVLKEVKRALRAEYLS